MPDLVDTRNVKQKSEAELLGDKLASIGVKVPKTLAPALARQGWTAPKIDLTPLTAAVANASSEAELRKAVSALRQAKAENTAHDSVEVKAALGQAQNNAVSDFYADLPEVLDQIREKFQENADAFSVAFEKFPEDLDHVDIYSIDVEVSTAIRQGRDLAEEMSRIVHVYSEVHKRVHRTDHYPLRSPGQNIGSINAVTTFGDFTGLYPGADAQKAIKEIQEYAMGKRNSAFVPLMPYVAILRHGGRLTLRTLAEKNAYHPTIFATR